MKTPSFLAAAATTAAALAAGALVTLGSPAHAGDLGTITLSQQSGSVTDNPMFASAVTSRPCPPGYDDAVLLRVGRSSGPFTNLAAPQQDGGYDTTAITIAPNRSFAHALGGPTTPVLPGAGGWQVVVECFSKDKRHAERFHTPITVTGSTWTLGGPAVLAADAAVAGSTASVEIEVGVSGPPSPTTSPPAGGGGLPRTGLALTLVVLSGVALVGGGSGAAVLARRRRNQRPGGRSGRAGRPRTGPQARKKSTKWKR